MKHENRRVVSLGNIIIHKVHHVCLKLYDYQKKIEVNGNNNNIFR